jgi:serine/threonine protein kinase
VLGKKDLSELLGSPQAPKEISENAKDLITKLLLLDPSQRLDAKGILNHHWVTSIKTPRIMLSQRLMTP